MNKVLEFNWKGSRSELHWMFCALGLGIIHLRHIISLINSVSQPTAETKRENEE